MKREYVEEKQLYHHQFHHHHSQPQLYHATTTSEDAGSHSPTHYSKEYCSPPFPPPPPPSNDGATIEVVRRPRGRPPGSKNKPKPPLAVITSDQPPSPCMMSPYVLELPPGVDVIESTTRFCRKRNMGLCVLTGNGAVSDFTLKQPSTAAVTFHGRFDILSISATILPSGGNNNGGLFTISVAGPRGQMVGGVVVGPLVSAATVYLIAATFSNPSFHRLDNYINHEGGDGGEHEAGSGGDGAAQLSGRVPIYNSYQPFTPNARQPQLQPPPPY